MPLTTPLRPSPEATRTALLQRLEVAAGALGRQPHAGPTDGTAHDPLGAGTADAGDGVDRARSVLAGLLRVPDGGVLAPAQAWLLLVAATAVFPAAEEVVRLRRLTVTDDADDVAEELLSRPPAPAAAWPMRLERDRPVVDVDFTARNDLSTGVQRVVRQAGSRWHATGGARLVVWSDARQVYRDPDPVQAARVLAHDGGRARLRHDGAEPAEVVVPWGVPLLLPEVAQTEVVAPLRGVVASRLGPTTAVGYDCIPLVSADLLAPAEGTKFVQYLSVVKHCDQVLAISAAAAEEMAGFVDMLVAQGLPGPRVLTVPLPTLTEPEPEPEPEPETADGTAVAQPPGPPEVLVVGSHDARKNHEVVLAAAERLWADGARFRLVFVGAAGTGSPALRSRLRRLRRLGHDVVELGRVTDAELRARYAAATCTVFPSLHEGFGLPVVESLSHGVPVVTSRFGATAELAGTGALLLVDPRSDTEVAAAVGRLLLEPGTRDRLAVAARDREGTTWDHYAARTWALATEPQP